MKRREKQNDITHVHRIRARARVIGVHPEGTLPLLELPNGHQLKGIPSKNSTFSPKDCLPEEEVVIDMSPYDLSKGQIISRAQGRVDDGEPSAYGLLPSGEMIAG